MLHNFLNISLVICFSILLVGCDSPESKILGKWADSSTQNSANYIEFFSDNTMKLQNNSRLLSGTWSILHDGRIKVDAEEMLAEVTVIAAFEGDALILETIITDGVSGKSESQKLTLQKIDYIEPESHQKESTGTATVNRVQFNVD